MILTIYLYVQVYYVLVYTLPQYEYCITTAKKDAIKDCFVVSKNNVSCRKAEFFPARDLEADGDKCNTPSGRTDGDKHYFVHGKCYLNHEAAVSSEGSPVCDVKSYAMMIARPCFHDCLTHQTCLVDQGEKACIATLETCPSNLPDAVKRRAETKEGKMCVAWNQVNGHTGGSNNYCENPDNDPNGPWCYIKESGGDRNYCFDFCTEITCPPIKIPDGAHVTNATSFEMCKRSQTGTKVQVKCNPGLFEARKRELQALECLQTGEWSEQIDIKCLKKCEKPVKIPNNAVDVYLRKSEFFEGDELFVQCKPNYVDETKTIDAIKCNSSGNWNRDFTLNCTRRQCYLPHPMPQNLQDVERKLRVPKNYFPGGALTIKCRHGYWSGTGGTKTVVCKRNGQWSSPISMNCTKKHCTAPTLSKYMIIEKPLDSEEFAIDSTVSLSCNGKHVQDISKAASKSIQCTMDMSNGMLQWVGDFPECAKICKPLDTPLHGLVTYTSEKSQNWFPPGTKATVECAEGYEFLIDSDGETFCALSGEWMGSEAPRCVKKCPIPRLTGGWVHYKSRIAVFNCNATYSLTGPSKVKCGPRGSFLKSLPRCLKKCSIPPLTGNGSYRHNSTKKHFRQEEIIQFYCEKNKVPKQDDMFAKCIEGVGKGTVQWSKIPACVPSKELVEFENIEDPKNNVRSDLVRKADQKIRLLPVWAVAMLSILAISIVTLVGVSIYLGVMLHKARSEEEDEEVDTEAAKTESFPQSSKEFTASSPTTARKSLATQKTKTSTWTNGETTDGTTTKDETSATTAAATNVTKTAATRKPKMGKKGAKGTTTMRTKTRTTESMTPTSTVSKRTRKPQSMI